ncbi:MAG: deoxyuridine 5'-triphosphate nucleotidohydrolase, partial [Candidatus Micrarchaeota archaeon]
VWDPGYEGRSESLLVVENARGIKLKRNARLVQLVFVKLAGEAREVYSGKYKNENI